jgi:hypothetical protein
MPNEDTRSTPPPRNGLDRILVAVMSGALAAFAAARGFHRRAAAGAVANRNAARFERRRRPGIPPGRFDRAMGQVLIEHR